MYLNNSLYEMEILRD